MDYLEGLGGVDLLEEIWSWRGCGLVGGGMSLEVGFEVSKAQCLFFLLLLVDQHLKPSATAQEPCLPV